MGTNKPKSKGKNWTKAELEQRKAKQAAKAQVLQKANNVANQLGPASLNASEASEDPYAGLSTRQKTVARLKIRGLSQSAIAEILSVSQPIISKEMKRIRDHYARRGRNIEQDLVVGESVSVYEEVEHKAWEIYHTGADNDKAKALSIVLSAREKQTKLLMDLGKLKKASTTHTHNVTVSPLVESWSKGEAREAVNVIISSQLTDLEAPEPPELLEENIIDIELTELEDPVPDTLDNDN